MKIYIQNIKVKTKRWEHSLFLPYQYNYVAKSIFNETAKRNLDSVNRELKEGKYNFHLIFYVYKGIMHYLSSN
jgi:hypothetical protein